MVYIIISIVLVGLAIGIYFLKITFYPNVLTYKQLYEDEVARNMLQPSKYNRMKKESVWMTSKQGYQLHGMWIPYGESKKTAVIVHGYTNNYVGSIRYVDIFREKGFNVLVYDQRYHGLSGGKNCTFGHFEKKDLSDVLDWVEEKVGKGTEIGIHGESMGASTALMHGAIDNRASFIIADCAYSDLYRQFGNRIREDFRLPRCPILQWAGFVTRMVTGVSYGKVSPIQSIDGISCPICFIHGDEDRFTCKEQSKDMYDKASVDKVLYLAKGADHAQSILVDQKQYKEVIHQFLLDHEKEKVQSDEKKTDDME